MLEENAYASSASAGGKAALMASARNEVTVDSPVGVCSRGLRINWDAWERSIAT